MPQPVLLRVLVQLIMWPRPWKTVTGYTASNSESCSSDVYWVLMHQVHLIFEAAHQPTSHPRLRSTSSRRYELGSKVSHINEYDWLVKNMNALPLVFWKKEPRSPTSRGREGGTLLRSQQETNRKRKCAENCNKCHSIFFLKCNQHFGNFIPWQFSSAV